MPTKAKTWSDTSKRVTSLSRNAALKALRQEALLPNSRPYLMRRLYARWRFLQHREDQKDIDKGILPVYLVDLR